MSIGTSQAPVFSAENISFQDRYKLTNLINGVDGGDSVAMRQLEPLAQDIQSILSALGGYVQGSQFASLFGQQASQAGLQNQTQVSAAIATALAGLPEPTSRLASVAVKTVYQGTTESISAQILQGFGLTASDNGDIDDASTTCVLVDSPTPGQSGLYQLTTTGALVNLNSELFNNNLGYYSRFYIVDSSREFAIEQLDSTANTYEVREIPYEDEYTGLGPIEVSNLNKTVNLRFSANDFFLGNDGLNLHPALKSAIESIPMLSAAVETLEELFTDLNVTLSAQITAIQAKLAAAFVNVQEILFINGSPKVLGANGWEPAPTGLVSEISGDVNKGLMRINHNRGVAVTPSYFEANTTGENQAMAAAFFLGTVTPNYFEVGVEKYKPVKLMLPAGLAAAAFS